MPTTNEITIYLKLCHETSLINAFADSQGTTEIGATTVLEIMSNPDGNPLNQPDPTISVVFVNPDDPGNVKCGTIEFHVAAADTCPFGNSTVRPDASKAVLIHDEKADLTASSPASNKATIRGGLAENTTYKFAIFGSWNCVSGPRTFTLDPIIKIQNGSGQTTSWAR
ncbi:MAG: hypothetical protein IT581_00235 [Verrucomicrobiales bacterium]|nr:hypothetical protein [Verrucomicrobiales bacterium]